MLLNYCNKHKYKHINTDTAFKSLPVDDEYKKSAVHTLRKCIPNILCLLCYVILSIEY